MSADHVITKVCVGDKGVRYGLDGADGKDVAEKKLVSEIGEIGYRGPILVTSESCEKITQEVPKPLGYKTLKYGNHDLKTNFDRYSYSSKSIDFSSKVKNAYMYPVVKEGTVLDRNNIILSGDEKVPYILGESSTGDYVAGKVTVNAIHIPIACYIKVLGLESPPEPCFLYGNFTFFIPSAVCHPKESGEKSSRIGIYPQVVNTEFFKMGQRDYNGHKTILVKFPNGSYFKAGPDCLFKIDKIPNCNIKEGSALYKEKTFGILESCKTEKDALFDVVIDIETSSVVEKLDKEKNEEAVRAHKILSNLP
jgi:hypothetical protein